MSEEKKNGISRREFLKDAGLVVGGATVGSMALVNACNNATTSTVTNTVTQTATTTATVGAGATVTVSKAADTVTVTATGAPGATVTKTVTGTAPVAAADTYTLTVNGVNYELQLQPWWNMAYILRDRLGLFGTKVGCDAGQCASCTVLVDGVPMLACLMLGVQSEGKKFQTVESLSNGLTLNKLQQKFYDQEAFQCGFCTPGILMAGTALLAANAKPTADDVREALAGHLCCCTNYSKVVAALTGGV